MAAKKPGTAISSWDEELAKEAEIASTREASSGGGSFFSTQGGQLSWDGAELPNNEMAVVILDTCFENILYEGRYSAENPSSPTCFAFAKEETELVPHQVVFDAGQNQSDECSTCEHNEWGSADQGRGKSCRTTRRLAMIAAGTFDKDGEFEPFEDTENFESSVIGYMKLPVTSVKGYANYVKQLAGTMKRPPYGMVTRISVEPDPKNQFKVMFESLGKIPDELREVITARRDEAIAAIEFPYSLGDEEEEEKPARKSNTARRPAAKKRSSKKASGKY